MRIARIDLAELRTEARSIFAAWDDALAFGKIEEAMRLRQKSLWPLVRRRFECEALYLPGIYAFVDNSCAVGWESLTYIGQSERTLRSRLESYIKDDSCWDESLVRSPQHIRTVGYRRLRPIMSSLDDTLDTHLEKHISTACRSRGCSLFVAGFDTEKSKLIKAVEGALIALAWSAGAPLHNAKIDRLPTLAERPLVAEICARIASGWGDCGLNTPLRDSLEQAVFPSASAVLPIRS